MMRYETADSRGYEFDYHADFTQFLEEARNQRNLCTADFEPAPVKKQIDWQKKNRKSWKNSLFSWLKADKRPKSTNQPTSSATVSKPRRVHSSCPIEGTIGGLSTGRAKEPASGPLARLFSSASGPIQPTMGGHSTGQTKKPASGPLTGLFSSTKRADECEVPYMCLGQLNNPQKLHSYGPVYLVT